MSDYQPIVDLSEKSEDFILGMEAGKLWYIMSHKASPDVACSVHTDNLGVLEKMAAAYGYNLDIHHNDDTWADVSITEAKLPPLRIVKLKSRRDSA